MMFVYTVEISKRTVHRKRVIAPTPKKAISTALQGRESKGWKARVVSTAPYLSDGTQELLSNSSSDFWESHVLLEGGGS